MNWTAFPKEWKISSKKITVLSSYHNRVKKTFKIDLDLSELKHKLLSWASPFKNLAHFDNNSYSDNQYCRFETLTAVSNADSFEKNAGESAWQAFETFKNQHPESWLFGYLGYDLKNELEELSSENQDFHNAPSLSFFIAEILVAINTKAKAVEIYAPNPENVWNEILNTAILNEFCPRDIEISTRISKAEYIAALEKIKAHIIAGDIYEINFCQEFYGFTKLEAAGFFMRLNRLSPAPFSAWFKHGENHIFCASPERFLFKDADKLVSQPIKGTIRRSLDGLEDQRLKEELFQSEKDRAENVMIVDLVRNDLSRTAKTGTVEVEELFGIYGFKQVWQMISTIGAKLKNESDALRAIKAAFPPGSMTGAPKIRSMELIDSLESSARGSFSGTLGYFSPDGNFDFNVLIRSIFYSEHNEKLSFQTGGAIVYDSDPEKEYEECMLKAKAMLLALGKD
jgi:para-aminobenzoate synthetase component 1